MLVYLHRVEPIRTINKFMYLNKPRLKEEDWGMVKEMSEGKYELIYTILAYIGLVSFIIGVSLMN